LPKILFAAWWPLDLHLSSSSVCCSCLFEEG
jgi:hypothetical protein